MTVSCHIMNNTVIFFGSEKPILNLIKYNFYQKLVKQNLITITTNEIYGKYPQLPNTIALRSNWKSKDIYNFTLHLLLFNFLRNNNKGLFYDLRSFLFGPYKIYSPKLFFMAIKFFISASRSMKFTLLTKNLKNSSDVLEELRKSGGVGPGDHNDFVKILKAINPSKVITISNFRDPKLFDLASACKELALDLHVFVECWDNISTGYGVPTGVSHFYTWSKDQNNDFYKFNLGHSAAVQICGSYRRSYADSYNRKIIKNSNTTKSAQFRILYLEGYFYENLNYSLSKIVESIKSIKDGKIHPQKIKIVVRRYPLKRQSIDLSLEGRFKSEIIENNYDFIEIETSQNKDLSSDFDQTDLVLSELTTAGLEAAFRSIPVVFLGSNSSIRFLDSMAGYNYSFAQPLKRHFELLNLSSGSDLEKLKLIFEYLLGSKLIAIKSNLKLHLTPSEMDIFATSFDFEPWNRLTET